MTEEERKKLAAKTKADYDEEARQANWATSNQNYTGWNGGSVTGDDLWAAIQDSIKYGYDIALDPRNKIAGDALGTALQNANMKANADAVAGIGTYDENLQNYYNQMGWTGYQDAIKKLQETGSLGLTDLDGNDLTAAILRQRDSMMPGTPYELDPAELEAMQQAFAQQKAQQEYIQSHLSPMMNGKTGGAAAGGYNMDEDPVWQAYLDKYQRAGEQGMKDVLAEVSARTGGMASSYATQAAQQTMNDYLKGATDMIPELEQQAYERDLTERQMEIAAEQEAYERQVAAEQQAYERQIYQQQLAADQQAQNANLVLGLMQNYGYIPTDEELAMMGLSREAANAVKTGYENERQLELAKLYKGSGGGDDTPFNYVEYLISSGAQNYNQALLALMSAGVSKTDAETAAQAYADMLLAEEEEPLGEEPVVDVVADVAYEELGGEKLGKYEENAQKYNEISQHAADMLKVGYTHADVLDFLRIAYEGGDINLSDYVTLKARYK